MMTLTFILFFIILFVLEFIYPIRTKNFDIYLRLATNLLVSASALLAATIFVKPIVNYYLNINIKYFNHYSYLKSFINFLLLDLSFYYWHRLNHTVPFLWRFHNVHHCDKELDITTAFRFHFGEIALSAIFRILQVTFIGVTALDYLIYEVLFILATMFHHSNIRIPIKLESKLVNFIVTPRMHSIHHSDIKDETNSNYSVVLSIWDKIHSTLKLNIPQANITIGVPGYSDKEQSSFKELMLMPFLVQKEYWIKDDKNFESRKH